MRSRLTNILALLAATAVAGGAGAAEIPQWTPEENWIVEYADNQCVAARPYRLGEKEMVVAFRPRPTVESVEIVVLAPGRADSIEGAKAKVFVGDHRVDQRYLTVAPAAKKRHVLYRFHLEPDDFEWLKRAERLSLQTRGLSFHVPLPRLGDVRQVLDHCLKDLLVSWGVSTRVQESLATFPEPVKEKSSYFHSDDYPRSALMRGNIGAVEVRVMVAPDGTARDCLVIRSSGHEELDSTTCDIVTSRATFHPARTHEGKAVEMPYLFVVHWRVA